MQTIKSNLQTSTAPATSTATQPETAAKAGTATRIPVPGNKSKESVTTFSEKPAAGGKLSQLADSIRTGKEPPKSALREIAAAAAKTAPITKVPAGATAAKPAGKVPAKASADKSGGKAATRAAAKNAVAEVKKSAAKAPAAKKAAKAPAGSTVYDWEKATADAKSGSVPKLPPFVSYGPHLKKVHVMAGKKDAAGIRELTGKIKRDPCPPSRKNLFRYADLCLAALKAKAA